jgi:hypothetical protein
MCRTQTLCSESLNADFTGQLTPRPLELNLVTLSMTHESMQTPVASLSVSAALLFPSLCHLSTT